MRLSHLTSQMSGIEHLLGKVALCRYESAVKQVPVERVIDERFSEVEAVTLKAAQNPARSDTPGYAQELTRIAYGELIGLLRGAAILSAAVPPAQLLSFDGANSVYVPHRLGTPTDAAGAFRAEAAPITVRGLLFGHQLLTPKSMGVILPATGEMLRRSTLDLAAYFQSAIGADTATALDAHFVGNSAASAIQPAGARNGLTAADTRASTGATAAAIVADLKAMLTAMATADMGSASTRWLMHPKNFYALATLLAPTGAKQFPETDAGRLVSIPVVRSSAMPLDVVLLVDFAQFVFAMGAPEFEATEAAEIHEEDTTPLPIGTPGAPATVAAPTRSLYQTYCMALRMMLDVDWLKLRAVGPVQELTAVAW